MLTKSELERLLASTETYRVERTKSTTDKDKFGEAVCAFANDMPDCGKPGYLFIGVDNEGCPCGMKATDELLQKFAAIRSDGNILPIPTISVDSFFPARRRCDCRGSDAVRSASGEISWTHMEFWGQTLSGNARDRPFKWGWCKS